MLPAMRKSVMDAGKSLAGEMKADRFCGAEGRIGFWLLNIE